MTDDSLHLLIVDNIKDRQLQQTSRWRGFQGAIEEWNLTKASSSKKIQIQVIKHDKLDTQQATDAVSLADGMILSGSRYSLTRFNRKPRLKRLFDAEIRLARSLPRDIPLLGICFGHQLIGLSFGFEIVTCNAREGGMHELEVSGEFDLVTPDKFRIHVEQHHEKQIDPRADLSSEFTNHASSETCSYQMIQHVKKPVYGVQFHPESLLNEKTISDGRALLHAFFELML
ncbi:hypothetical protein GF325_09525 [Candidatus Bathyarchaeota archaeon]|nr:hypothetical protein [Candidatus Bathyarchaeota archaeon]